MSNNTKREMGKLKEQATGIVGEAQRRLGPAFVGAHIEEKQNGQLLKISIEVKGAEAARKQLAANVKLEGRGVGMDRQRARGRYIVTMSLVTSGYEAKLKAAERLSAEEESRRRASYLRRD